MPAKRTSAAERTPRKARHSPMLERGSLLAVAEFVAREESMSSRSRGEGTPSRGSTRRNTALPLCMPRSQHEASLDAYASSPTPHASRSQSRRTTGYVYNHAGLATVMSDELPENVERAMQMLTTYPLMKVAGTAFQNSLNTTRHAPTMHHNRSSMPTSPALPYVDEDTSDDEGTDTATAANSGNVSTNTSMMLESSVVIQNALDDSALFSGEQLREAPSGGGRSQAAAIAVARTRPDKMVRLAAAMKRASMWQSIVVVTAAHFAMVEQFRFLQLRSVLEKRLLPTLLQRREKTGSVIDREAIQRTAAQRRRSRVARLAGDRGGSFSALPSRDATGETPTCSFLRENCTLFAQLGNSALLDALAGCMVRYRYVSGEVMASADEPSQTALRFLVSGKCEYREKSAPPLQQPQPQPQPQPQAQRRVAGNALPPILTGSSMNEVKSGGPRSPGVQQTKPSSPRSIRGGERAATTNVRVLFSGESFGGIFSSSSATFQGTYKAISQCILWVLRADDFERVFKTFADRTMMEHYVAALREHTAKTFPLKHPLPSVLPRVPVYRTLNQPMEKYLQDFTPIVMVRGEKLFDQGDPPGYVYCLVEGSVRRCIRGADGRYASGVSQILSLNSFSTLKIAGRCVLLGEEPHILPCAQRYRCTISSRSAMLFRISGERFVSALLDDPTRFVALRERLTNIFKSQLKLDPACLAFAPLLRSFPASSLQTLAQVAEPRVYGRSVGMCEPAQSLREVFLVMSGDVRDQRAYGHQPTRPLPTPPTSEDDEDADEASAAAGAGERGVTGTASRGGAAAGSHSARDGGVAAGRLTAAHGKGKAGRDGPRKKNKSHPRTTAKANPLPGKGARGSSKADTKPFNDPLSDTEDEVEKDWMTSSFFSEHGADLTQGIISMEGTMSSGQGMGRLLSTMNGSAGLTRISHKHAAALGTTQFSPTSTRSGGRGEDGANGADSLPEATPDEQQEFNPAMPPLTAKRFLFTLGGGWEGLLLDKWPNGWGTTSLVEAWAIPTAKVRAEFNCCPKATQTAILLAAREQQKLELGLPALSTSKLPPMSSYQQGPTKKVAPVGQVSPSSRRSVSHSSFTRGARGRDRARGSASQMDSLQSGERGSVVGREMLSFSGSVVALIPSSESPPGRSGQRGHGSLDSGRLFSDGETGAPHSSSAPLRPRASLLPKGRRRPSVGHAIPPPAEAKKPAAAVPKRVTIAAPAAPAATLTAPRTAAPPPAKRPSAHPRCGTDRKAVHTGGGEGSAVPGREGAKALPIDTTPSRNLLALYNGEFRDDELLLYSNIVREPAPLPSAKAKGASSSWAVTGFGAGMASAAWPRTHGQSFLPSPSRQESDATAAAGWFREVPVCEPLPGTAAPLTAPDALPAFATNTMLLTRTVPRRGEALQAQADYFSASNAARMAAAGDSPSATARQQRGPHGATRHAAAPPGSTRQELPKRHALAM